MGRDVRLRVRQCEICQVSKHGRLPGEAGRRRLYTGRPWQVVSVDLVGPMPLTPRGNSWILVLTDHFTRWANALAIPDASAPTVARVLDQHVFCYFGLPEQIYSDQGAQFQSQLMSDLCRLWGVNQSRTTPYHSQGNRVVERNNRMLGDALRSLLLDRSQEKWDTVLPQVMRAYHSTLHTSTGETPNLLMLGRETRVPDHLTYHVPEQDYPVHEYASELVEQMKVAHEILWEKQWQVRKEDFEEPPLYQVGDWVWMVNYRMGRRQMAKLQPKFVGPYAVVEVMPNHTYKLERSGQVSVQNETRLKPYWAAVGEAPPLPLLEPWRQKTRGWQRLGPEYEVVMPRAEDLVRDERPLPLTEARQPSPAPDLMPSLPKPETGLEVQTPLPREGLHPEISGKNKTSKHQLLTGR